MGKRKEAESAKQRAKLVKERTLQISKLERPQDIADSNTGPIWKGNNSDNLRQTSANSLENSKTTSVTSNSSNNFTTASSSNAYQKLNYNPNEKSNEKSPNSES